MTEPAAEAAAFVEHYEAWLRERTPQELISVDEILEILGEVRGDDAYWEKVRPRFDEAWERTEKELRAEQRSVREILSPKTVERILDGLERADPDPEAIKHFLRSPAIEATLASILYAGIFEFMKKIDIVGRIVNKLPVIGPIRRKVMGVFKDELEGKLEGQIKGFLGGFSGLAVDRLIQFVLSDENRAGFATARRRLGEHLLDRPLGTLLPDAKVSERIRQQVWKGLREPAVQDERKLLERIDEHHGKVAFKEWTWPLSARAKELWAGPLGRFFASDAGQAWRG